MTQQPKETQRSKQTRRAGGPALGNAVAYFVIVYLGSLGVSFDDQSLAVAMGGAIVAAVLGNLKDFARWVGERFQ